MFIVHRLTKRKTYTIMVTIVALVFGVVQVGFGAWTDKFSSDGLDNRGGPLIVYDGDLYVGGSFTNASGATVNRIARWDGAHWKGVGGITGSFIPGVRALVVFGGQLIAGGRFGSAGGISASNIAAYDGENWYALGSGTNEAVNCLAVYGGDLYVGGVFTTAGGQSANHVARWDGDSGIPLGLVGRGSRILSQSTMVN